MINVYLMDVNGSFVADEWLMDAWLIVFMNDGISLWLINNQLTANQWFIGVY